MKLSLSKELMIGVEYDNIFIIVDRLIKYTYFIPYKEVNNTKELVYIFLQTVITNYRLSEEIILD